MDAVSNVPWQMVQVVKQKTPNFHQLVEAGLPLPKNPYFLKIETNKVLTNISSYPETWQANGSLYKGKTQNNNGVSFVGGTPMGECGLAVKDSLDSETTYLQGLMTNKILKKIKTQSLSIGLMYAERRKTGELLLGFTDKVLYTLRNIRHPAKVLAKFGIKDHEYTNRTALRLLKKKVYRQASVGDAFMQYKFAWLPTYYDLVDSLQATEEFEKRIHTFSHKASQRINITKTITVPRGFTALTADMPTTGTRSGICKAQIDYGINDISLVGVASFMDVPTTLWDFVPYSFVIDRIVDISSFLDLQNATIGLSVSGGFNTLFYKDQIEKTGTWYRYSPNMAGFFAHIKGYSRTTYNLSSDSYEAVYLNRLKITTFPSPMLEYPLRQHASQVADEMILARKLMKKRL